MFSIPQSQYISQCDVHPDKDVYNLCLLVTLTDLTVYFFKSNTPHVDLPEYTVQVYALGGVSSYNKVKFYSLMGGSLREMCSLTRLCSSPKEISKAYKSVNDRYV